MAAEQERRLGDRIGFDECLVDRAGVERAFEREIVAQLRMDHRRCLIERGLRVGDGRQLLVFDFDQLGRVLGERTGARDYGEDRLALPARALDRDRVLRRGFEALEMREDADPRGAHLRQLRAGDDGDHAGRALRHVGFYLFDARVRVGRAHEGDVRHARQDDVAHVLPAPLREPREVRARHRAADIGIGPIERAQTRRQVARVAHCLPPARARATVSTASTMA